MKKRERVIELESTNISYLTISGQVRLVTSGFDKTSIFFLYIIFLSLQTVECPPTLWTPTPSDKLWLVSVTCLWDNSSCFISVCVCEARNKWTCAVWGLFF